MTNSSHRATIWWLVIPKTLGGGELRSSQNHKGFPSLDLKRQRAGCSNADNLPFSNSMQSQRNIVEIKQHLVQILIPIEQKILLIQGCQHLLSGFTKTERWSHFDIILIAQCIWSKIDWSSVSKATEKLGKIRRHFLHLQIEMLWSPRAISAICQNKACIRLKRI